MQGQNTHAHEIKINKKPKLGADLQLQGYIKESSSIKEKGH